MTNQSCTRPSAVSLCHQLRLGCDAELACRKEYSRILLVILIGGHLKLGIPWACSMQVWVPPGAQVILRSVLSVVTRPWRWGTEPLSRSPLVVSTPTSDNSNLPLQFSVCQSKFTATYPWSSPRHVREGMDAGCWSGLLAPRRQHEWVLVMSSRQSLASSLFCWISHNNHAAFLFECFLFITFLCSAIYLKTVSCYYPYISTLFLNKLHTACALI